MNILRVCMVLTVAVAGAAAMTAEYGYLPAGTEIRELRTGNSRHFANGNGTITAEGYPEPIYRLSDTGEWQEIDAVHKAMLFGGASTGWVSDSMYKPMMGNTIHVQAKGAGDIRWGYKYYSLLNPQVNKVWHGWAKYSLAGIPPGAVITRAVAQYYVYGWPVGAIGAGSVMASLEADPMTLNAQQLWNILFTNKVKVIGVPYEGKKLLWVEVHFSDDGLRHLEASINQGWAAFIYGYAESRSGVIDRGCLVYGYDRTEGLPYIEITYNTVGVEEPAVLMPVPAPRLVITPNPAVNRAAMVRVEGIEEMTEAPGRVSVYDVQGRVILSRSLSATELRTDFKLDGLANGNYFVRLETAAFSVSGRLLSAER